MFFYAEILFSIYRIISMASRSPVSYVWSVTRLNRLLRIIFFSVFVLAIITFFTWTLNKPWIDFLEREWIERYVSSYQAELDNAIALVKKDPQLAEPLLLNLVESLDDVRKLDRLYVIKESAFEYLVQIYEQQDRFEVALSIAEKWRALDERNLILSIRVGELKRQIPGEEGDGVEQIRSLYERFYEAPVVADAYRRLLVESGDDAGLLRHELKDRVYRGSFDRYADRVWLAFLKLGNEAKDITRLQEKPLIHNNTVEVRLGSLKGVQEVMIKTPIGLFFLLGKPELLISINNKTHRVPLWRMPNKINGGEKIRQDAYGVTGHNSSLVFSVPEEISKVDSSAKLTLEVLYDYPELVRKAAATPGVFGQLINEYGQDNNVNLLDRLQALKLNLLNASEFYLRWNDLPESRISATVAGNIDNNRASFSLDYILPENTDTTFLLLRFPALQNMQYRLKDIQINSGGKYETVTVSGYEWGLNDLEFKNGAFLVTGPKPSLFLGLNKNKPVSRLRIVGDAW